MNLCQLTFILNLVTLLAAAASPCAFAYARTPAAPSIFRFSVIAEPHSLDPQASHSTSGNYLFHNVFRGLYVYSGRSGLKPFGAVKCDPKPKQLVCQLNPQHRWSNGEAITAADYVRSFRRLLDPKLASPQSSLLFLLKSAKDIWQGQKPPETLGVTALDTERIQFDFQEEDYDFLYKLAEPALAPWPKEAMPERANAGQWVYSGPFHISSWKIGQNIELNPSPFPKRKIENPKIEVLIVADDTTAMRLYEQGRLHFLRRLPDSEIIRFRNKPDYYQHTMARFDYIGFGPELWPQAKLRRKLIEGVDFALFSKLFNAKSPPGCPSVPSQWLDKNLCLKFKPNRSAEPAQPSSVNKKCEYLFYFSQLGGDDIARAAEWFQNQWAKNTGYKICLEGEEQTSYLARLKKHPPAIFRKGVSLDRPTCLAALELFTRESPDNYIGFDDPEYEKIVSQLRRIRDPNKQKKLCREGMQRLMRSERLLPLGEVNFTMLVQPRFKGWDFNELNQLDLSQLVEEKSQHQ